MAKKTDNVENKALTSNDPGPVTATTEEGAKRAEEQAEAELKGAEAKRQKELAQSGYSVPDSWYTEAKATEEREQAIAKNQPKTQDQEHSA